MEIQRVPIVDRIQSLFIDLVFIIILMMLFSFFLDQFNHVPDWVRITLFVGIWLLYEHLCIAYGCTLGNYIKQIRVRDFRNQGRHIGVVKSFVRYVVKSLLGWISFFTVHTNIYGRAIHDMAGGSVVMKRQQLTVAADE